MSTELGTLVVIAKRPEPGRVKTRLVPPLTHHQAAEVAAASLRDTLRAMAAVPARRHVLAFAGDPDGWLPSGWEAVAQCSGGLDARLAHVIAAHATGPTVLVGMDTPQARPEHVLAFDPDSAEACLGPAPDGGYWAIGFRDPRRAAATIPGVPMSQDDTAAHQLRRLGTSVQLLDELMDVDTFPEAEHVARLVPDSDFAATVRRVAPVHEAV